MNYHVLTLFPEMILQGLNTSIIGRAIEKGILSLEAVNIRDYAGNRYGKSGRLSLWRRSHGHAGRACSCGSEGLGRTHEP